MNRIKENIPVSISVRDYGFIAALLICLSGICFVVVPSSFKQDSAGVTSSELPGMSRIADVLKSQKNKKILPRGERKIEYNKLIKGIKKGSLSKREAMFYHVIQQGEGENK